MVVGKLILRLLATLSIFIGFGALVSEGSSPRCPDAVNKFLTTPTQRTFSVLSGSNKTDCWSFIGSSNASLNRLIHSVEKGNQWAALYLANNLKSLDGGNLEDSLIALGQFGEHSMERLLSFQKNGRLSKQELADTLTMLPLSLSDNPFAQLDLLRVRRIKVMNVTRFDLLEQREFALKAIDDFVTEIKSKNSTTTEDHTP